MVNTGVCSQNKKYIYTFLSIIFLIFNRFSIQEKFWKTENQDFPIIPNPMYVNTVNASHKILIHSMLCMLNTVDTNQKAYTLD